MNDKVYRTGLIELGCVVFPPKPGSHYYKTVLNELGDCWSPDRNVMQKGMKEGNNSHPLYNDIMTETYLRWKRTK